MKQHEPLANIRHGLILAVLALILGALWAAFLATQHERLHGDFETQQEQLQSAQMQHLFEDISKDTTGPDLSQHSAPAHGTAASADNQHSHSGNPVEDAMRRLLRGHVHFMGLGVLAAVLLLVTAATSLKPCWQKLLGWSLGIGALAYPPAWILMGFRTVKLGPEAAEASVMWLFGPSVALLLASMVAVLVTLLLELSGRSTKPPFTFFFATGQRSK